MTASLADPFLQGARDGVLLLQTCRSCGARQLPPRLRCLSCGETELSWTPASGAGRVATFTILHRAPDSLHRERVPYVYAVVELMEGPRIVSNIIHSRPSEVRVGQPVMVCFEPADPDDQPWPVFEPVVDGKSPPEVAAARGGAA